ncbi:alpha/beta fold hydrolase [Bifidobacterium xylocopae]|nr:alpha/beta hydrolase [Bifidobacterium xylocopae]
MDENGRPLPTSSSRIFRTHINGAVLAFSMNPAPRNAPILLYLHGGPGDACIPLTKRYNAALERHFRFINLDQRGCGLSYYPFRGHETVSIGSMLADVHTFVARLVRTYPGAPITLLGHSWGSVLGLEFARRWPSLIRRFIGVGQVISMPASHQVRSHPSAAPLPEWVRRIVSKESDLADVLLLLAEMGSTGRRRGLCQDVDRILAYLTSRDYGYAGLRGLLLGSSQSHDRLDTQLDRVDFSSVRSFGVPVIFFEGRHDRHLPSRLVDEYASALTSPHEVVWFERSGHCPQWEEPGRFSAELFRVCVEH